MQEIFAILRFGLPYLRRYWFRFVLGILCGFVFGLSNGAIMGGISLLLNRLSDPARVAAETEAGRHHHEAGAPAVDTFHAAMTVLRQDVYAAVDPWLPLFHRPLDWKQIVGGFLLIPLLTALRGIFNYATSYFMAWSSQRISADVKEDVFRKIGSLSLDFFHRTTTAEMMSRINGDTAALAQCLRLGLADLVKEPSTIVTLFAGLLLIDWKLTLIAIAFIPLCLIPSRIVSRKIKARGQEDNRASVSQAALAMESFQNMRVTKAYELGAEHARLFRQHGRRAMHFAMKAVQARSMLNPLVETVNALGIGAVFLYVFASGTSLETLGSFMIALGLFYGSFRKLGAIFIYFSEADLAIGRLIALFKLEPTVREAERPEPFSAFARGLEFRDVGFAYGDHPVLEKVSFRLPRGGRLGLAGESGSGKSSLINLLFRFYDPTSGVIEIDGRPLPALRIADLRAHLALVSQDVLLFNATVAENIAFGKLGASREEVVAAAREAHAHDFISALPHGYDTELGERGLRLSGGQRQRIAIARAFVRNAPILVLDEATASLDSQSEAEVQKAIDHLAENRTVICVAHRLSTLRAMDRILVLQKGRVMEEGSFDELLARGGLFAAMAARQSIFPAA